jgi:16S rRNA (adenine1518-N6/adenine1519-N6)-dimethyltransferase
MKAKKHLGQHFLTSEKALRQMVEAAGVQAGNTVLEIGPGKGALTKHLLATGAHVVAVEMDSDMIAILEQEMRNEIGDGRLKLIHGDIVSSPALHQLTSHFSHLTSGSGYKLVANIPYYITGEIIRTFLQTRELVPQPTSMTLLVQKEVAQRVARSEKESVLSLSIKAYGTPHYVATVPAGAFSPPPAVDSAILHVGNISKDIFRQHGISEEEYFAVVKTGLGSKRKMLLGLLSKKWPLTAVESAFSKLEMDKKVRGEDVPLLQWVQLTKLLSTSQN